MQQVHRCLVKKEGLEGFRGGWFVPELVGKETLDGGATLCRRSLFESFGFRITANPCVIPHVGHESANHQIPKFKDGFVGSCCLLGETTMGDHISCDDIDANLDAVCFQEEVEVIESQSLFVQG